MAFVPAPPPKSLLGHHRILSPNAAIRVSPLCLGAMNFGNAWRDFMGECSKETSFEILDYFWDMGGNFIDTANAYQAEESEEWIGEWMEERGNRDQMVVATKYTTYYPMKGDPKIKSNYAGNHTKSLRISVDASLKKLRTDYIDLLYVHWWDSTTSIPELMQSLNTLVRAEKVLYLGISDAPAWVVSKANEYARNHGLRGFSVYQGLWNAATRDVERDILPMAVDEGMALAPWGALGRGAFKTVEEVARGEGRGGEPRTETQKKVVEALRAVGERRGAAITGVALAYVRAKAPYVFPIVGGRKIEHLKGNIEALGLRLSEEEVDEIERATADFNVGFPNNQIYTMNEEGTGWSSRLRPGDLPGLKMAGVLEDATPRQPPESKPLSV